MLKITKVEVIPRRDRFGIEHRITLEGDTEKLENALKRFASVQQLNTEGGKMEIIFTPEEIITIYGEKPFEDYYDEDLNNEWKAMVMDALGMEEPFRYYSFFDANGRYLGTIGFKQDCENPTPVIPVYKNFG